MDRGAIGRLWLRTLKLVALVCWVGTLLSASAVRSDEVVPGEFVAIIPMDALILPGTSEFLKDSLRAADAEGAVLAIVTLNTPGGMLQTAQEMIQTLFESPIPVVVYVTPSGATAASAGVFITLAGHVAAMAPGTSIGAAHPVAGDGKNIESDMRTKAENMTASMVKAIAEQRGRNAVWAEKSVKESVSVTEREAKDLKVIDLVAKDFDELLRSIAGRTVMLKSGARVLPDLSAKPRRLYDMPFRDRAINVLANPNVVALLWLGATTGLSLELYSPGAILPGVVGVICLVLALTVSQIIPVSQGAVLLMLVGSMLIGLEFYVTSGILGVGGIVAIALGAAYLIDVGQAPGLQVDMNIVVGAAVAAGVVMLAAVMAATRVSKRRATTGSEGIIGQRGKAMDNFTSKGNVFVNGEIWAATSVEGIVEKNADVEVVRLLPGFMLEVRALTESE